MSLNTRFKSAIALTTLIFPYLLPELICIFLIRKFMNDGRDLSNFGLKLYRLQRVWALSLNLFAFLTLIPMIDGPWFSLVAFLPTFFFLAIISRSIYDPNHKGIIDSYLSTGELPHSNSPS